MLLKNKKTGEIATLTLSSNGEELLIMKNNEMVTHSVKLSDLEEWEDYEEPKEYWCIDTYIYEINYLTEGDNVDRDNFNKAIGNYFETKEEAEQAVEKLEAWKRLKDKGFRFVEWQQHGITEDGVMDGAVYFEDAKNVNRSDLDLLFGGEE